MEHGSYRRVGANWLAMTVESPSNGAPFFLAPASSFVRTQAQHSVILTPSWVRHVLALGITGRAQTGIFIAIAVVTLHLLPFVTKYAAYIVTGRMFESDFRSFYLAADAVFNHGRSPYSLDIMHEYEVSLAGIVYPFLYPPTTLPWLYPLSLFGFNGGIAAFQLVSAVSLGFAVVLLYHYFIARMELPAWRFIMVGALFAYQGFSETLAWAQVNLIVLALIVTAWIRANDPGAGRKVAFCLFTAAALKTYPVAFVLIPLVRRRYNILGWFSAFWAANVLLALVVLPVAIWGDWLRNIVPSGGYGVAPPGLSSRLVMASQNLNGLFIRLFDEGAAARVYAIIAVLICAALTAVAVISLRRDDDDVYYGSSFAILSAFVFLAAPLSWQHHFVFLIPALVWAAVEVSRIRNPRGAVATQAVLLLALMLCAYKWPMKDMAAIESPWVRSAPMLGPLLLFGLLLALAAARVWAQGRMLHPGGTRLRIPPALRLRGVR